MLKTRTGFPVQDAKSLSDIISSIGSDTKGWGRRWFRGVCGDHPLQPQILRDNCQYPEDYIVKNFRRMGGIFVKGVDQGDQVSVICLAQHYGLPTRLLDWTESITVSLYFSFEAWRKNKHRLVAEGSRNDLYIWCLNPIFLNVLSEQKWAEGGRKRKKRKEQLEQVLEGQEGRGVHVADSDRIKHMAQFSIIDEDDIRDRDGDGHPDAMPVAFYPHFFDHRIYLQRSCFTIQGRDEQCLEMQLLDVCGDSVGSCLRCYRFPEELLSQLENEFRVISPTPTTILGDVQGLVEEILSKPDAQASEI